MTIDDEVRDLYRRLVDGWNASDAAAMAAAIASDGLVIGFDGSQMVGRDDVRRQLAAIFADHETATYVVKVRSVRPVGADAALLHAVAGMVPPDGSEIMPDRNAIQTVVAGRGDEGWRAALFQTTPAQFHGRPELTEQMTSELAELLPAVTGRR
jgi:uncharacterized protein (TIGR02246 family)